MAKEVKRGAFIVIEGLDRSGKSTQAAALCERLAAAGISVKLQKFPGALLCSQISALAYIAQMSFADECIKTARPPSDA